MGAFLLTSCSESSIYSTTEENKSSPTIQPKAKNMNGLEDQRNLTPNSMKSLEDINDALATSGKNIRLSHAETVTLADGGATEVGQTIYANDRQKRLSSQWVPGDERRNADGNNLTYLVYEPYAPANWGTPDQVDGEPAIDSSFDTWNHIKGNAKLNIVKVPDTGLNPSYILGGSPFLADISEIGFLPPLYFELFLSPGSSENVLSVTFTFNFVDENGNPTDINNDGYADTALKEVWYNDAFLWTDSGNSGDAVDIETVALHENGHALGFGHFGKISVTDNNNKLHVSPRAVMNAIILGTQRDLLGTDKASYNNIYGNWAKN
ncbi:hypothetical protein LQ318_03455 [Aliifodinibius salicampi]|uniref:Matrixin n=2 Tax=Fodinibius salicampi TaxID=1920655 RepID=A0ABT3PVS8_9BACT|nr:hypothetical protein [Fodinibius salicampi]MCW9711952.1 hypothetical protein [Fodinibius salicampi]